MSSRESHEGLLEVGFTPTQIEHLSKFRQDYVEKEKQLAEEEQRRLEFIRWLVANGRLTDH
jgi:hypothetical protein